MKTALYVFTALLLLMHSFTAIIGEPGDFGYRLVLKPYPSFLKVVPNMEEGTWKKAVASGRVPEWVAAKRCVVIGYGSAEMRTQPWEYLYRASFLLTAVCSVASLALVLRSLIATLRSRSTWPPHN